MALMGIINSKIKDARLIKLIWKFLKAGYCEDWQYHMTYSGTPQGGICSPIFANIYLHELDKFVVNLAKNFNKPKEKKFTPEYQKIISKLEYIRYFAYLMEYSCLKTLAGKHKCKTGKIRAMYKDGLGGWGIPYQTKTERKRCYFAKYGDCKDVWKPTDQILKPVILFAYTTTNFEERLSAKVCELCGTTNAEHYEIHHVHKVKDLQGKELWEQIMIAKRRKTLVVCEDCHKKIHGKRVL